MKAFRLILILLIAAAVWGGLRGQLLVTRLQSDHDALVARARAVGLPEQAADDAREARRSAKRADAAGDIPADRLKDEVVAAYRRMKALDSETDPGVRLAVEDEVREWIGRLTELSAKELKQMIDDLAGDTALDPEEVRELVGVTLNLAASRQGEIAAELALAHRALGGGVGGVIGNWARQDPARVFAWLEENRGALGEDHAGAFKEAVRQAAASDPALALEGLLKIGNDKERASTGFDLAASLMDDESRAALVAALRGPPGGPDRNPVLNGLGRGLMVRSAAEPGPWMDELSGAEALAIAEGMTTGGIPPARPERWLDWMLEAVPGEQVTHTAGPMLSRWIQDDYRAAGAWIKQLPPGEIRNGSVANYARLMSKRFPDAAMEWANILPEGPEKSGLLEQLK